MDTVKFLYETRTFGDPRFEIEELPGWQCGSIPTYGLTWVEGHPMPAGALARGSEVAEAASAVRDLIDERFGVEKDRGVSRSDQTVTTSFETPHEARAFLTGMAAVLLPRLETTRRGHPVHSISWSYASGSRKLARAYDKGLESGGEAFQLVRLEDQRRYRSGARPPVEEVADPEFLRGRFEARFGPIRKAVDGVKAASFPVVSKALADEARYGFRPVREAERLAGALVMLTGGAGDAYPRATRYRRRAELRDAGFVVVEDTAEAVEVNLGDVIEQALDPAVWA